MERPARKAGLFFHGIVAYKGTKAEMAKLRKWFANEPDSPASAGPNVRFRQTATRK
jgi:hypothetical protein